MPVTGYGVKIVRDGDLPENIEWMFVKTTGGGLLLYLTQTSAGCARALAEAWAAYRALDVAHLPTQRRGVVHV